MAWTAPKTWVDNSDVLSATNLNTHLRDNLLALTTWASYTPTWTSTGTAPAIGNGTLTGRYCKAGNLCHFSIYLLAGSTTTFGTGYYRWSLPATVANSYALGGAQGYDSSASSVATGITVIAPPLDYVEVSAATGTWAATSPFTWANGDWVRISGTYEC